VYDNGHDIAMTFDMRKEMTISISLEMTLIMKLDMRLDMSFDMTLDLASNILGCLKFPKFFYQLAIILGQHF
jgi:hypothetical protein